SLPCSQAPQGAICDNGPGALKIVAAVNSAQCTYSTTEYNWRAGNGVAQPDSPASVRCGIYNNGQFSSPFGPSATSGNSDKLTIYKMINNFNTSCGRISKYNPFASKGSDPQYQSPNNIYYGSTYSDQYFWWTSVGC